MTCLVGAIAFLGIFAVLISGSYAEVTAFLPCHYPEGQTPGACTIHQLRVEPCKEAAQGTACRLKRGRNATISFDYTANFDSESLEARAFWVNNIIELPFAGLERNACLSTPCPVVSGQKQTYSANILIAKSYPARSYDVKWQVTTPKGDDCCFIVQIKIHK